MLYLSKTWSLQEDCPEREDNNDFVFIVVSFDEDNYESVGASTVSSLETGEGWVMDSCLAYHMCLRKEYFKSLKLTWGGIVLLGDDKACKVHGIGIVILKMFDDHEFLLHNMRHV